MAHQAYQTSLGLSGMATELGLECDCSGGPWLSPQDFLNFRAEWLPYLARFSAAVHESTSLPQYVSDLTMRQRWFLGSDCPETEDFEPEVPAKLPRFFGQTFFRMISPSCNALMDQPQKQLTMCRKTETRRR